MGLNIQNNSVVKKHNYQVPGMKKAEPNRVLPSSSICEAALRSHPPAARIGTGLHVEKILE